MNVLSPVFLTVSTDKCITAIHFLLLSTSMEHPLSSRFGTTSIAVLAVVVSVVAFIRGGSGASPFPEDALSRIQREKVMRVCYAVWPPAVIKDPVTGELSGHDVDALRFLAEHLGAEIEYHEETFGNMATAVQTGVCDIGTSLFVKVPRAAVVAFSRPLFYAGNSGLVRAGDTRFRTIADVDKPGVRVAVATGESGDIYAQEHFEHAEIVQIDVASSDLSRFMLEVTSGRADIAIADANTIRLFAAEHPETTDVFAGNPFDVNPDAWPMRLEDTAFRSYVDNSLLYLETSGRWTELEKKYGAAWLHALTPYGIR